MLFVQTVCQMAGYVASYWNRLIMPEKCRDPLFDNYPTLVRSAGSWVSLGQVVDNMMGWYSWRHIVVMNDKSSASICPGALLAVLNWLKRPEHANMNYSTFQIVMQDNPTDIDLNFYLDLIQQRARGNKTFKLEHNAVRYILIDKKVKVQATARACLKGHLTQSVG